MQPDFHGLERDSSIVKEPDVSGRGIACVLAGVEGVVTGIFGSGDEAIKTSAPAEECSSVRSIIAEPAGSVVMDRLLVSVNIHIRNDVSMKEQVTY